jgi:PAS domain S-box-containing protein
MGNWVWDLKNDTQHWSDETYRILGLEPQSIKAGFETFLSMIHPGDKDRFRRKAKALLSQEEDPGAEYRIIRTDGEKRHLWLESLVFNPNGRHNA